MRIKRKSMINNKLYDYNVNLSSNLRKENKSNDLFEAMLGNLTLEEIIALKLELSFRNLDKPMYGFRLYRNLLYLVQDAMFKFAMSITTSNTNARKFLGLDKKDFRVYLSKYETKKYLIPEEKKDVNNSGSTEENI